jgi:hypothetical protein
MPGRSFTSPGDYNTQLAAWLPRANARMLRRTGQRPGVLVGQDVAAMGALPPVAPSVGASSRVRLARDYYVRVAGNDYSVDPTMIGRFVDVHAGLGEVVVTCAGTQVAAHVRSWSTHQTITDPDHVAMAGQLRTAFQARTAAMRGPVPAPGTAVGQRALSHYDEVFGVSAAPMSAAAGKDVAGEVTFLARELKAPVIAATFTALGDQARQEGWSHEEYLAAVLGRQVASRVANGTKMRLSAARFPQIKTLEDFTFTHLPTAPRDVIAHLATTTFVARKENVVLLGPPVINGG